MKPIDYIIIGIVALIVAAVAVYIIRQKLKGEKVGCGCGCQSCPHAAACGTKTAEKTCENDKNDADEKNGENDNEETV